MWGWSTVVVAWIATMVAVQDANAYRVLFLAPISSKSHKNFFMGIASALAKKDHQVTMVSPYQPSKEVLNIREVVVPKTEINDFVPNLFEGNFLTGPLTLMKNSLTLCSDSLESEKVQALLKEEFDVVILSIFFSDCYLALIHQIKVPFVYVSPMALIGAFADVVGNPIFPSFVVSPIFNFRHPLTFTQRLTSTMTETLGGVSLRMILYNIMEWVCRRRGLCPDDMPSINEMRLNSSLVIVNSVKSLETPARPYVPAVVHVGGIHCRPAKPLPQDLEEWVEGSGQDGFIYFSLGSVVRPSDLPESAERTLPMYLLEDLKEVEVFRYLGVDMTGGTMRAEVLVKVFGSLKQRVLWKWDAETMPDLPTNVRLGKWLPQQDILGHPKLRLFMTHGGLLSTLESIYHGTPVLGLPVFGDQHTNMKEVQMQGWGEVVLWKDLNEEDLKRIILNLMQNPSIRKEVQHRSLLMRDRPMSPESEVVYWVEYVVRHDGALHLRCPSSELSWFKLYNMDVWLLVLLISILLAYATFFLLRAVCKKVFSRLKPKSD